MTIGSQKRKKSDTCSKKEYHLLYSCVSISLYTNVKFESGIFFETMKGRSFCSINRSPRPNIAAADDFVSFEI